MAKIMYLCGVSHFFRMEDKPKKYPNLYLARFSLLCGALPILRISASIHINSL